MSIEEKLDVPYLPRKGYDNPVTFKVANYMLEVSYQKDATLRLKHFIDEKGMSKGYEIQSLRPYPVKVRDGFVNNEIKERFEMVGDIDLLDEKTRQEIIQMLLSDQKYNQDFNRSYRELLKGFYEKTRFVEVAENKKTLSDEDFNEILIGYRIMADALSLVKNEEIRSYLSQAEMFDKRLLLPSRTYLKDEDKDKN